MVSRLPVLAPAKQREKKTVPEALQPLTVEQEQLIEAHMAVVRFVARAIHERVPQHVELDELMSAGMVGLVDAVRRFNAEKSVQFRSYAQFRVRGAILDSLRSLDWSPRELRRKGRQLAEVTHALGSQLGRPAQDHELAAAMELSLGEYQKLAGDLRGLEIGSLHAERGEETGEDELAFLPAKESENPLFQYLEAEDRRRLIGAIDALPPRERTVMTMRYFEEKTMKEIGVVLGVVESRVSQLHGLALHRLRGVLATGRRSSMLTARRAS